MGRLGAGQADYGLLGETTAQPLESSLDGSAPVQLTVFHVPFGFRRLSGPGQFNVDVPLAQLRPSWKAALLRARYRDGRLAELVARHGVDLISIGNGTGSRETDRLALDLLKRLTRRKLQKVVVHEAGAAVFWASELATKELPDLDVSLWGAASIARRLQEPLADQDGLVHASQLSATFVKDPNEVVKASQVVRVKVQEVDLPPRHSALTIRPDGEVRPRSRMDRSDPRASGGPRRDEGRRGASPARTQEAPPPPRNPNAFAKAFADLQAKKGSSKPS